MRTLDHEVIESSAFLKEVLGAVPADFALELHGDLAEPFAAQVAAFVVKRPLLLRWLASTSWEIPAAALPRVLDSLCEHVRAKQLTWLALRSSDRMVTWFEAPHFGDDLAVQLHDGFPDELATRLIAAGIMLVCESESVDS